MQAATRDLKLEEDISFHKGVQLQTAEDSLTTRVPITLATWEAHICPTRTTTKSIARTHTAALDLASMVLCRRYQASSAVLTLNCLTVPLEQLQLHYQTKFTARETSWDNPTKTALVAMLTPSTSSSFSNRSRSSRLTISLDPLPTVEALVQVLLTETTMAATTTSSSWRARRLSMHLRQERRASKLCEAL